MADRLDRQKKRPLLGKPEMAAIGVSLLVVGGLIDRVLSRINITIENEGQEDVDRNEHSNPTVAPPEIPDQRPLDENSFKSSLISAVEEGADIATECVRTRSESRQLEQRVADCYDVLGHSDHGSDQEDPVISDVRMIGAEAMLRCLRRQIRHNTDPSSPIDIPSLRAKTERLFDLCARQVGEDLRGIISMIEPVPQNTY